MEDQIALEGGCRGFCVEIVHREGDPLNALLKMDDAVSYLSDVVAKELFTPSGNFFTDRKQILGLVDALAEQYGLDKKQSKALNEILRVYALRNSLPQDVLFYTDFRPRKGECTALRFIAKWGDWVVVKKRNLENIPPHDALFFLSSVQDTIRRKIRESVQIPPVERRRASKSALKAILDMYSSVDLPDVQKRVWLRAALEAAGLPMEYGIAFQYIRPKVRGRLK